MVKVIQATYEKGKLLLTEELGAQLEGQVLNVIVFQADETKRRRERFLAFVDKHGFSLPDTYQFNREELYGR
ncbi:MAG: hypothetical protein KC415_16485 [Anaerolineales bacterium]|nr:hypothetical protein [Anaerolineales bacterium]MCB8983668.1 hypothetical protein [Ardenticatenaceae bacterium]